MFQMNNFPSGGIEKVKIDGKRVKDKMELYSFRNQITLDMEEPADAPLRNTYRLNDGKKIHISNVTTSQNFSGQVTLSFNGHVLNHIDFPSYEIPADSYQEDTTKNYKYRYSINITNSNNIYLAIERYVSRRYANGNLYPHGYGYSYLSCYQLIINDNDMHWDEKFIETPVSTDTHTWVSNGSPCAITTDEGMYIVALNGYHTQNKIMFRTFDANENNFETVSSIYSASTNVSSDDYSHLFLNNDGKTICCYCEHWGKIITVERQEDGSYVSPEPQSFSMVSTKGGHVYTSWFNYQGNQYLMWLCEYASASDSIKGGLYFYKVNENNNGFDMILNVSDTATRETHKVVFSDGMPAWLFVGRSNATDGRIGTPVVEFDGTFELYQFNYGTFEYQQLTTPFIKECKELGSEGYNWNLYEYKFFKNCIFFYFDIEPYDTFYEHDYEDIRYKCVIITTDNTPLLYSTFIENDFI